jgi:AmmeMemoRadiSam system protein B
LTCNFFDEMSFSTATGWAEPYEVGGKLLCGVVPHHLLADRMIASFFNTAAKNRPGIETVIIIAPMHDGERGKLATTRSGWRTPTGDLPVNDDIAEIFIRELGAVVDDRLLREDHSASALVPFVSYYFPGAKTACLLISKLSSSDTPLRVAEMLASVAEAQNCLLVFSVDFSHYLTPLETDAHDMQTREAVMSGDLESIMRMGNDNMDSTACVSAFILFTELMAGGIQELDHSNSLIISGLHPSDPAFAEGLTSYFILAGVSRD